MCLLKLEKEVVMVNGTDLHKERDTLERTVEDILFREGCNDITCIDLRLLGGYNENISKNAQNELIAALMEFIRCSHRF